MERSIPRAYALLFRPVDKLLILVRSTQTKKAGKSFFIWADYLGILSLIERKIC